MKKKVYVFNCTKNKMKLGLTYDSTGANLPHQRCDGQWILYKVMTLEPNGPLVVSGHKPEDILDAIDRDGFMIQETRSVFI
jgi:hypothetical protein